MHLRMFATISMPDDSTSDDARHRVFEALLEDESFCGGSGRFGSPLSDWFVIGGRWSGVLAQAAIGEKYLDAVRTKFPELAADWYCHTVVAKHATELDAMWADHGGRGPSPYTRDSYDQFGYPDDAAILTQELYDRLLLLYVGESCSEDYVDLDDEQLNPDFIGRKWLVVVDYHQ